MEKQAEMTLTEACGSNYTVTDYRGIIPTLANLIGTGITDSLNQAVHLTTHLVKEVLIKGNKIFVGPSRSESVELVFVPWAKPKTPSVQPASK